MDLSKAQSAWRIAIKCQGLKKDIKREKFSNALLYALCSMHYLAGDMMGSTQRFGNPESLAGCENELEACQ